MGPAEFGSGLDRRGAGKSKRLRRLEVLTGAERRNAGASVENV